MPEIREKIHFMDRKPKLCTLWTGSLYYSMYLTGWGRFLNCFVFFLGGRGGRTDWTVRRTDWKVRRTDWTVRRTDWSSRESEIADLEALVPEIKKKI